MEEFRAVRVSVRLSHDAIMRLFERAERWDIARGGRFEAHAAGVVLWSAAPKVSADAIARGAFYVGRDGITRLEWDPTAGGSAEEVWQAIKILIGPDLPFDDLDAGSRARR